MAMPLTRRTPLFSKPRSRRVLAACGMRADKRSRSTPRSPQLCRGALSRVASKRSGTRTQRHGTSCSKTSHVIATTWPLPPPMEQCETIVHARARFHAEWWDDPRLGASVGAWLDADAMDRKLKQFAEQFARFTDRVGDSLP